MLRAGIREPLLSDSVRQMSTATSIGNPEKLPLFNLTRSFALISLVCIAVISSLSVIFLYVFLQDQMLARDAMVTQEFVQRIADLEEENIDFSRAELLHDEEGLGEFFAHVASMTDVVRTVIYNKDGTIVWASDKRVVGQHFEDNPSLLMARQGELAYQHVNRRKSQKQEHRYLPDDLGEFVETYVPIRNRDRTEVVGVAEIYRVPGFLINSLRRGMWAIWLSAAVSGLLIYVTLLWVVRRASAMIETQQERLVEAETMGAIGAMAAGLAHGIRNPLASIRSSAELSLEETTSDFHRGLAEDIVAEVDRLELWIRKLILVVRPEEQDLESVEIGAAVRQGLASFAPAMDKRGISVELELEEPLPPVRGNNLLIDQVLQNLISNAVDAMPEGGTLTVAARTTKAGDQVELKITDTGEGLCKERIKQVFKPFVTTKSKGLGLGLSLVKHLVERLGGTITLSSQEGRGTTALLLLPEAVE